MIYAGDDSEGSSNDIRIYDNHFSISIYPNGGYWGVVTNTGNGKGNVWENNTWVDGPMAGSLVLNPSVTSPPIVTWNRPCTALSSMKIPQGSYLSCVDGNWNVFGNPMIIDSASPHPIPNPNPN